MFDLLKKWLSGDINASSERKLDESAKKDSFLADALEGYRSMPEADHVSAVEELKVRLNKKSKRKAGFAWQRIAAAAAVIFAVGLIYLLNTPEQKGQMAGNVQTPAIEEQKNETAEISSEGLIGQTDSLQAYETVPPNPSPIIIDEVKEMIVASEQARKNSSESVIPEIEPTPIEATDIVAGEIVGRPSVEIPDEPTPVIEVDTLTDVIADIPPVEKPVTDTAKTEQSIENADSEPYVYRDKREGNQLKGIVRDEESGEGLIGVSILIKGTSMGTVTDFDGKFTLTGGDLPWSLIVSYTGYMALEVDVYSIDKLLEVGLSDEGVALSEVVVSSRRRPSRKAKKKRAKAKPDEPQPKKGFKKLKRYLKNEMRYPEAARENGIAGKIMLSFYINSSGRPENISIVNSLGYGLDEEAIRLLENGPDWEPANSSATYELEFSL